MKDRSPKLPPERRAQALFAAIAVLVGVVGLIASWDCDFAGPGGQRLGELVSFTPLGALLTIAFGVIALASALLGIRRIVAGCGIMFCVLSFQVLLQYGRSTNWLGSRGSNLSFWLGIGLALLVLALPKPRKSESEHS